LILVASFMVVLDFTIVNIALPSMERDFGVAPWRRTCRLSGVPSAKYGREYTRLRG
jgi:MFS family permease